MEQRSKSKTFSNLLHGKKPSQNSGIFSNSGAGQKTDPLPKPSYGKKTDPSAVSAAIKTSQKVGMNHTTPAKSASAVAKYAK